MILSTAWRKKKMTSLSDTPKPQNLGACVCAPRKAVHTDACMHQAVHVCTGYLLGYTGVPMVGANWGQRKEPPLKRRARLEFEGASSFWLAWKIRSNRYEGLPVCPV